MQVFSGFRFNTINAARGNVLFMLLIAIALLAALTVAVSRSDQGGVTLNREQASLNVNKVIGFGTDLKRGVEGLLRSGISEASLSFAHLELPGYGTPDSNPTNEVFNIRGGGVAFVSLPNNISDATQWEIHGYTAAPGVGDADRADLMLVLPAVKDGFCEAYNAKAGLTAQPVGCVYNASNRFSGAFASGGGVNVLNAAGFSRIPAPYACVRCGTTNQIYYVLSER